MEAWLSWLEHTVHIREVTGSSPVASTNAKTLLFSRVFLLSLVFATVSKVRSAPHTLCALCPSVTLHAPLSNASISAPLMSESCPSTTRNLKDFSGCFFVFRSIVLAQSVAGNKRQDNAQHLRVVRDPFGETGRSFALQTACTVALFLLSLVFATVSKVRSAPHTLCALCPSVTLHAPLSNASISAPLMGESCPSTTLYQSAPMADWFFLILTYHSIVWYNIDRYMD